MFNKISYFKRVIYHVLREELTLNKKNMQIQGEDDRLTEAIAEKLLITRALFCQKAVFRSTKKYW